MEETILNTLENDSEILNNIIPDDIIPEDVQQKLSSVFERYQQLSDEEKEQFQKGAFDVLTKALQKIPSNKILPTWLAPYESYILFIFAVSFVAVLLVFSARRLYRRTWEREQRQAEKKRLKQQKIEAKQQKAKKKKKQKTT
ncbi:uncharacterized protein [Anoplolepis gracilipes]|uniref:uncharacterized protein n=1 Tax=Anoplolepis gracilipes TaxID=354296 RepID=UPI003B9F292B